MAKQGTIEKSQWLLELSKLAFDKEMYMTAKWAFGQLFSTAFLLSADARKIHLVLPQGSLGDSIKPSLTITIPDSNVSFVRQSRGNDVVLCMFHPEGHFCLSTSTAHATAGDFAIRFQ
jgi:hypothetical protein